MSTSSLEFHYFIGYRDHLLWKLRSRVSRHPPCLNQTKWRPCNNRPNNFYLLTIRSWRPRRTIYSTPRNSGDYRSDYTIIIWDVSNPIRTFRTSTNIDDYLVCRLIIIMETQTQNPVSKVMEWGKRKSPIYVECWGTEGVMCFLIHPNRMGCPGYIYDVSLYNQETTGQPL